MSTTVTYKGETLTTATNQTRTLDTAGTYLEDDITITDVTTVPTGTKNISITSNGTTTEDVTNYASASITANVPNSYTSSDEGKVVSSGALVSQTSATYTENGTYDTTLVDDVTVNVAGASGWGADDVASRTSMTGAITCSTATKLMPWCFAYSRITSFSSDTVTNMENTDSQGDMFYKCSSLTSVSIPNVTTQLGAGAFLGCTSLQTINIPNALTGMVNVFNGCTSLQEATFTKSTAVGNSFFLGCSSLAKVDLSSSTISTNGAISANTFKNCSSLKTIILRKSTIFTLGGTSAFDGTPFASGGTGGTIYVPSALINSYKSATNWSTLNGYGTVTWTAIENSYYETHYADGTVIS